MIEILLVEDDAADIELTQEAIARLNLELKLNVVRDGTRSNGFWGLSKITFSTPIHRHADGQVVKPVFVITEPIEIMKWGETSCFLISRFGSIGMEIPYQGH
ncbi:hypothetical protein HRE53_26025 (plasmid) [Acaryochloris sp. 'Moss Beach']|uniref:hypothetical protein n=1 Tax=Acaryochloris sp. 'Moss Beach' TaxID=2740837 RepID=UPI001F199D1A|nr:hypothetical protein [Acaryochloris sp. 'Moss Beach']UJB72388.1 hypothetical protein HRE53_26025 [Acaryochloris sp. 'Moss Beach']